MSSFNGFNKDAAGDIYFVIDESRPLVCIVGLWTNWTSVRKVQEGEVTTDILGFLTTKPNAEVEAVHPKAAPVILTTLEEVDVWMRPRGTRRRLCNGRSRMALRIIARGVKKDGRGGAET